MKTTLLLSFALGCLLPLSCSSNFVTAEDEDKESDEVLGGAGGETAEESDSERRGDDEGPKSSKGDGDGDDDDDDDGPEDEEPEAFGGAGGASESEIGQLEEIPELGEVELLCGGICLESETCCDEICVDVNFSEQNCGACEIVCDFEGAVASCEAGVCSFECLEGSYDCDGSAENGCEITDVPLAATPVLTAPMLGAFTGSIIGAEKTGALRPTFKWTEVETDPCFGIKYELQVDNSCPVGGHASCDFASPEVHEIIDSTEFTPDANLPVSEVQPVGSRYSWRVRACAIEESCSDWSTPRYVDVGRIRDDITGDGYADVVGLDAENHYSIFEGGRDFGHESPEFADRQMDEVSSVAQYVYLGFGPGYSSNLRFVGDVNGDGFNDVAVDGQNFLLDGASAKSLSRGLLLGAASVPQFSLIDFHDGEYRESSKFIAQTYAAGDFNADGYADLFGSKAGVVSSGEISEAYLFLGSPTFSATNRPNLSLSAPSGAGDYFGASATSGDFNGDGWVDLAFVDLGAQRLHFVYGGRELDFQVHHSVPFSASRSTANEGLVCDVSRLDSGNWNGDGIDDLAVSCYELGSDGEPGTVDVFLGSPTPPSAASWTDEVRLPSADIIFSDMNGDGLDELITAAGIFPGGEASLATLVPLTFHSGIEPSRTFSASDLDGDGLPEVTVASGEWLKGAGVFAPEQSVLLFSEENNPVAYGVAR